MLRWRLGKAAPSRGRVREERLHHSTTGRSQLLGHLESGGSAAASGSWAPGVENLNPGPEAQL